MSVTIANIKIEPVRVLWDGTDMGALDGDVELSFSEKVKEITAHQEGSNVLGEIRTGHHVELKFKVKETSVAQLKKVFDIAGASVTPASGTEVSGWGNGKDFTSLDSDCKKLVLHPVVLGPTDYSRDFAFWKAYLEIESINWSGENIQSVSLKAKVFPDLTKTNQSLRLFVQGDHTQTL